MSLDKRTVILSGEFNEDGASTEEFKEYSAKANLIMEQNGGSVVAKYMVESNMGDGDTPQVVVISEFPSKESAKATFEGDDYQSIIPLRKIVFKAVNILMTK